jgi:hypothetical protein
MNEVYAVNQVYTVNNGYELAVFDSSFYLPIRKPGAQAKISLTVWITTVYRSSAGTLSPLTET